MASNQFELLPPPSDAISSLTFSPTPSSTLLLVTSWDKHAYLYDAADSSSTTHLVRKFAHRAPVLAACFGRHDGEAFTAGLDWDVRHLDLATGVQTVLSTHGAGVRCLAYSREHRLLVSGGWDATLHVHALDQLANAATADGQPAEDLAALTPATVPLPAKPFAVSLSASKLVAALASRIVLVYDLRSLALLAVPAAADPPNTLAVEPWQRRESSLKYMTRAVACMPPSTARGGAATTPNGDAVADTDGPGFAASSIEGRVAVEWFDPSAASQSRKYAFKCHRSSSPSAPGVDVAHPVNALAFHPAHGTFASGGGDGVVALWDGVAKRRIRQYARFPGGVVGLGFSAEGGLLAVGVSPGFEDGGEGGVGGTVAGGGDGGESGGGEGDGEEGKGTVRVFVRELAEGEAKGKAGK